MDDSLFRKLAAGARFSRQDCVKAKKEKERELSKTRLFNSKIIGNGLPDELDFFKDSKNEKNTDPHSSAIKGSSTSTSTTTTSVSSLKIPKKPMFKDEVEMRTFRNSKGIKVYGTDIPCMVKKFVDLCRPSYGVPMSIIEKVVVENGLKKMSLVQKQGIPMLLAGRDAFIVAPTGSGKTLVFVIALITNLLQKNCPGNHDGKIKAIVISPTRELAAQIKGEFRKFTPTIVNAKGHDRRMINSVLLDKAVLHSWQMEGPKIFPEILIATPKRLVQAIETKAIDLSSVQSIILDEADKLLELGLMEQVDDILSACTFKDGPIQKVLLSATIPTGVEDLAKSFMNEDPIKLVVGVLNSATSTIEQKLLYVGQEEGKLMAIRQLLIQGIEPPVIIFCETINRATLLFHELVKHGINVDMIHGDRTQAERERIVAQFRAGRIWFLITTELLARGIDFPDVSCVINYDFPLTTASYIHRIGRTGRAGKKGSAITLYTTDDVDALKIVANVMRQSGCEVPDWMLQFKRNSNHFIAENRKRKSMNIENDAF